MLLEYESGLSNIQCHSYILVNMANIGFLFCEIVLFYCNT